MDECPHGYRAFNEDGIVIAMACDSWSCPVCQRVNAFRWSERIRYGLALRGERDAYFWTLTLPGYVKTSGRGFALIPDLWDRLRREIQRYYSPWDYAAFVELHPQRDRIPHFHVISLSVAPARLKDIAAHCGFGYMAKELPCTGKMAAVYVAKYCSKQGYEMPRGFRRVRISQSWPKLPAPAYEKRIYPQRSRETTQSYLRRIASTIGQRYDVLYNRWIFDADTNSEQSIDGANTSVQCSPDT